MDETRLYENYEEGFSLCAQVKDRLPDYIEGYLDAMTAEAIRSHLTVCYMCNKVFDEMERSIQLVETLPFVEPHIDFTEPVMAAIQKQAEKSSRPWWYWLPKAE